MVISGLNPFNQHECVICLEILGTKIIENLICGHIFHAECIEQSFLYQEKPNCPICRASVIDRTRNVSTHPIAICAIKISSFCRKFTTFCGSIFGVICDLYREELYSPYASHELE